MDLDDGRAAAWLAFGDVPGGPAESGTGRLSGTGRPIPEHLNEAERLRLISPSEVGRLAYNGRFGPTVLPVNYVLHEGTIVFRTAHDSPTDEDLRTGIAGAEYKVAFQIDNLAPAAKEGGASSTRTIATVTALFMPSGEEVTRAER